MAKDGYSGVNSLANVLNKRMRDMADAPPLLDYATINRDMSLRPDTYPVNIPKKAYTVCRALTLGDTDEKLTQIMSTTRGEHGGHYGGDGSHTHDIAIPKKMRSLKPGDRVLIAWVGNDACVIDVIKPVD